MTLLGCFTVLMMYLESYLETPEGLPTILYPLRTSRNVLSSQNITFLQSAIVQYLYILQNNILFFIMTLTLSDPGYFRQLTIRGGALKAPPYDLENYFVNLHHIIHVNFTRCFWHNPIGIFQKFAILTILQRFENKK